MSLVPHQLGQPYNPIRLYQMFIHPTWFFSRLLSFIDLFSLYRGAVLAVFAPYRHTFIIGSLSTYGPSHVVFLLLMFGPYRHNHSLPTYCPPLCSSLKTIQSPSTLSTYRPSCSNNLDIFSPDLFLQLTFAA